ncbi:MAG: hypothetical protein LR015_13460 [Verrucomicrobia bacterium]|nr:hypothetical protein [Verrucomicrobiota bacterium]
MDSAPRQDTESAPESGTAEAETAQPEIPEADTEATQAAKNPPTKSNPGDEDEGLFAGVPKHNAVAADEAVIIFKGWIGSYNKLFLRGDPPHLDWEKSIQPEPLGIGEWRWRAKGVKATFKCKPILNDEHWALGPDIMVQPGKLHRVDLKF